MTLQVRLENQFVLQERVKLCRIKYPAIVLPIFFQEPFRLEADQTYIVAMNFEMNNNSQEAIAYLIQHPKEAEVTAHFGHFKFHEPLSLKEFSTFAYMQCGHMRFLYFWPINKLT